MIRHLLVGLMMGSLPASAQLPIPNPVPVSIAPVVDSLSSFERPNGALLRTGVLVYDLSLNRSTGQLIPLGTRTVTVTEASLGGVPGWLVAESRTGTILETTDSVYVARADLAPERWAATNGRSQLGVSFTRDSMYGALQNYQGRSAFVLPVPPNALISAGLTERLVELLPLREGYRAAATLVLIDGTAPRLAPAEIAVHGMERVRVGSLTLDAWRVSIRSGALEQRLWVGREGSRVIRAEQAVADGLLVAELRP